MTVKTEWKIKFKACGHVETKDLSHKRPDERAGFAQWLATKQKCTPCWRKDNGSDEWVEDRQEWLNQKRAEELEAADKWAATAEMPELAGTEKQVTFATSVRYRLMRELYTWAVEEDQADQAAYELAEDQARGVDQAKWWLDNMNQGDEPTDPDTLVELLESASASGEGSDCENRY